MDLLQAITIILAYRDQGKLSGAQRRLLMTAQKQVFETAEEIRARAEGR
jgi:hypothetical protein